ncbi:hypothetical protein FZC79_10275 [Rossellomorea vietnamensis]|uniref:Uncharacterized protein n=1 Tax=Rossellomorea vietnamensis TaxID=218284 RepID=A0A5D4KE08_9BACI|nr:hypothetical protein [Rossellomorea vietnamensis]TYR75548.1 hypothetical protein FZC79_10275 [Rossellomorea vietnamensis]
MIDRRKNLCYIVTVHYLIKNGEGVLKSKSHQFISLHSINTEKCRTFAKNKARSDKQFHQLEEEWLSQYTVPNSDYCK